MSKLSTRVTKGVSNLRKQPQQGRSRATVDVIIHAGAHILGTQGLDGLSTNKVAELAGVSIGSVYQYFPDKIALIKAIRDAHIKECLETVRQLKPLDFTVEAFADKLVACLLTAHDRFLGLHKVLLDEAPPFDGFRDQGGELEVAYLACFVAAVGFYRDSDDQASNKISAMVLSDMIDGVVHNAARRGMLKSPLVEKELARQVMVFLQNR